MFTVLLICGGLVGFYLLLCVTVLHLPKCKSMAKLHGKTVIVTGMCSVLVHLIFPANSHACPHFIILDIFKTAFAYFTFLVNTPCVLHNAKLTTRPHRHFVMSNWIAKTDILSWFNCRSKHWDRQSHRAGAGEKGSSCDSSLQGWKPSSGCCHRHPEGESEANIA